jgi:NAD(P)-dependent dehydrogenase (short-subunit alcohol dehydrogenase family)
MDLQQLTQMYDFAGQTFVVTGGAGVLGADIVCALAGLGADVVILDRNMDLARALLERLGPRANQAEAIQGDVLSRESLNQAAAQVVERFGGIDGLINAAGGNMAAATTSAELSFFDLPEDALRFVFDLNLIGTILPCQVFGRQMAGQGEGVILNFSSMNAFRPLTRIPAYSAAKAGVSNFTQWLAVHMAQNYAQRIRVNAVAPGFFLGEQNRYLLTDRETGELTPRGRTIIDHTPMGRFGVPEDLLGTVLWLLSPASAFVTGITVPVDGGFSAYGGV